MFLELSVLVLEALEGALRLPTIDQEQGAVPFQRDGEMRATVNRIE